MDLDYLIDQLESLLDHGSRIPMTSRVMLDEDEYMRLIDQLRISVPQEVRESRQVLAERERILSEANERAEGLLASAQEQAVELVSEHSVAMQAQQRAGEVLETAHDEAASIRAEADRYALDVLRRIYEQVDAFRRTIQNGIQMLEAGSLPGDAATGDGGVGRAHVEDDVHVLN